MTISSSQRWVRTLLLLAAALGAPPVPAASAAAGDQDVLTLRLGDPGRRLKVVRVAPGTIVDTSSEEPLDEAGLVRRLAGVRLLFFGEDHDSNADHEAQLRLIRSLHAAGRDVVLALEMFPWQRQPELDRWSRGEYAPEEFTEALRWDESWGHSYGLYREIFEFARSEHLPLVAINAPRDLIRRVRAEGMSVLADSRLRNPDQLPPAVQLEDPEHRELMRAYLQATAGSHGDADAEGMYRAQSAWDAIMGWNALRAARARPDPAAIVVVLIGGGHVTYNLGAPGQIRGELPEGSVATVVPVAAGPDGVEVQASYADFIWGLPLRP